MFIHGDKTLEFGYTVIMLIYYAGLYREKKKKLEIDSKVNDFVLLCWFILIETLEFSNYILLLCRFMEIEKLEFDSTVMKLYY